MSNNVVYRGPGLASLLLIAFIILKLCGVITWSWLWVLSPLWISLIIEIIFFVVWIVILCRLK